MYNAFGGMTSYRIPSVPTPLPAKMPVIQCVYVLRCKDCTPEHYKWYIGITVDLKRRLEEHFQGRGSEFTKVYKPLDLWDFVHTENPYIENLLTLMYMGQYGPDNVRGGPHTMMVLDPQERKFIDYEIRSAKGECMKCGSPYHFIAACGRPAGWKNPPSYAPPPTPIERGVVAEVTTVANSLASASTDPPLVTFFADDIAEIPFSEAKHNRHTEPSASVLIGEFEEDVPEGSSLIRLLENNGIALSLENGGNLLKLSGKTYDYRYDFGRLCNGALGGYNKGEKIWYLPNTESVRIELTKLFTRVV
jgi:hypothetical protein